MRATTVREDEGETKLTVFGGTDEATRHDSIKEVREITRRGEERDREGGTVVVGVSRGKKDEVEVNL